MSIYITATLNRIAMVEEENEIDEKILKLFKNIATSFQLNMEITYIESDDYNGMVYIIHNEVKKIGFGTCVYSGAIEILPEVDLDDTFFERTESFLKEIGELETKVKRLSFDMPKKRMICTS